MHARRICLYRAGMDGKEVDPGLLKAAEHTEAAYQDAHELVGIRKCGDRIDIAVQWEGLPDEDDRTWEPLLQVHEDIPRLLTDFLESPGQKKLKATALRHIS